MFSIGDYLGRVSGENITQSGFDELAIVAPVENNDSQQTDYTTLIRTKQTKDRNIQSTINDIKPLRQRQKNISLAKPSEEDVRKTTERTRKALDLVLQSKLGQVVKNKNEPEFVKYTSSNVLDESNTGSSRMIKIIDVQEDPMAPPKFKQKKHIERPPSPPAPVLHAPSRKATAEEQKQWYIPPAISNWKNPNGFTIAIDKRLAVDGRDPSAANTGGQINENFINLATALEDADKKAREEIKIRNAMKKKLAEKENKEKEEKLKQLAQRAREERLNAHKATINNFSQSRNEYLNSEAKRREMIREERRRKAEKELRMSRMGNEQKLKTVVKSLGDRDISERTQLGLSKATQSVENQFDSRLFTKSTQVTNSEDQVYDNPLFTQQVVNSIYQTRGSSLENDPETQLESITNEKRFEELSKNQGPVQFEKAEATNKRDPDLKEYGLQFKKPKTET